MQAILSIDPGVSTGIVLFTFETVEDIMTSVKRSLTVHFDDFEESIEQFEGRRKDLDIVVEQIPMPSSRSPLGVNLLSITSTVKRLFPTATYITPGIWKPVVSHITAPPKCSTIHERDAFLLGYYYIMYYSKAGKHDKA